MYYSALDNGPFQVEGSHDPDQRVPVSLVFRPPTWQAGKVYLVGDIVIPSIFKGYCHEVSSAGISNATTEPAWRMKAGAITQDYEAGATEGLEWTVKNYGKLLLPGIDIADIIYTASNGVVLSGESNTATKGFFYIEPIDANAVARSRGEFEVSAHVILDNGTTFDATLLFNLNEH